MRTISNILDCLFDDDHNYGEIDNEGENQLGLVLILNFLLISFFLIALLWWFK
jgi:hypothetical protein